MDIKKVGVLTSGGDAPGMNAAVRSVVRSGLANGFEMIGIERGYHGFLRKEFVKLNALSVSNFIQRGGTVLQTARSKEFTTPEGVKKAVNNAKEIGLDALVVIGGDGTFRGAQKLTENGLPTIAIPATIDNDISCTDYTLGFDTAMNIAMDCVDKLRDTCTSHERCAIVEVMGRGAGYIALEVGIASGAELVLIPEKDAQTSRSELIDRIVNKIYTGKKVGKKHHIVIVAEGIGGSYEMAKVVEERTGIETRATIIGHIQRGGSPTVRDRVIAARMGMKAIELLKQGKSNRVVIMKADRIEDVDINEGLAMTKTISEDDYALVNTLSR